MNKNHKEPSTTLMEKEEGWLSAEPFLELGPTRSFVSGDPSGDRIALVTSGGCTIVLWSGRFGLDLALRDHPVMLTAAASPRCWMKPLEAAAWMAGHPVVATRVTIIFRKMLPLGRKIFLEAQVQSVNNRKLSVSARLLSSTGEAFAEANGIFIELSMEHFRNLATGRR